MNRDRVAGAQTQPSPNAPVSQAAGKGCRNAQTRLEKLNDHKTKLEARIDKLKGLIQQAQNNHRDNLVARLQARLDKVQRAHDHVVDTLNRIHQRCGV